MTTLRCKWVKMEFSASLDDVSNALYRNRFVETAKVGYDIVSLNHDILDAIYIEKITLNEKIVYPNGEENFLEYERYSYIKFSLRKIKSNIYILKIEDAPKSLGGFFNSFKSALGISLSIEAIKIDILYLVKIIMKNNDFSQVKISQVKVSGIKINNESSAKIEVNSISNALDDFQIKYKNKDFLLDSAKVLFKYDRHQVVIELKKSGVTVNSPKVLYVIENDIIDAFLSENESEAEN
ncbi:hypothetical protein [Yersinia enterocolitica]|uniref:hypothetical protein n=1 Tax=Yersinia enterocolitica TaxID=630 RepID=UPI00398CC190